MSAAIRAIQGPGRTAWKTPRRKASRASFERGPRSEQESSMPASSDQSGAPANEPGAGPVLRVVVLLEQAPANIAEALDLLMPEAAARIRDVPLKRLSVNVNGAPVEFEVSDGRLEAPELDYAVRQSPLRDRVAAAIARHGGYLVLSTPAGGDVFGVSDLLSNIAANYADDDNGLAVWLPDADHVTTDVMYTHEVEERPALTWFNTMAARLDEASSIAHTIGVRHLGGGDVQLRTSALDPAAAHRELRGAVAGLLEERRLPAPGTAVVIAGTPHVLTPAPSAIGLGEVLEAVPAAQAQAPASSEAAAASTAEPVTDKPRRRGWFGRR